MNDNQLGLSSFDALIDSAPKSVHPITPATQGIPAMSSLEIARITGKPHNDVLKDIRRILEEAEIGAGQFSHTYTDGSNRQSPCYLLPRRECDLVVSGYSVKYRLAIIDRWHELEAREVKQAFNIPQTYSEALRLSADLMEEVEAKKLELKATAPKVEFYNTVTESNDVIQLADAANIAKLPFGRNTLFQRLRELGYLITGGERHNQPYRQHVASGVFMVNQRIIDNPKTGEAIVIHTTYATQKGLALIVKLFGKAPATQP